MTSTQPPVFVYGTLRRGHPNYERLLKGHTTRECPATLDAANLYGAGQPYPFVTPGEHTVVGELIWLTDTHADETITRLDRLEGFRPGAGDNLYARQLATVRTLEAVTHAAWVYYAGRRLAVTASAGLLIAHGDWDRYRHEQCGVA